MKVHSTGQGNLPPASVHPARGPLVPFVSIGDDFYFFIPAHAR
jgi:hypothetical protein